MLLSAYPTNSVSARTVSNGRTQDGLRQKQQWNGWAHTPSNPRNIMTIEIHLVRPHMYVLGDEVDTLLEAISLTDWWVCSVSSWSRHHSISSSVSIDIFCCCSSVNTHRYYATTKFRPVPGYPSGLVQYLIQHRPSTSSILDPTLHQPSTGAIRP